jgi:hypothetical protein
MALSKVLTVIIVIKKTRYTGMKDTLLFAIAQVPRRSNNNLHMSSYLSHNHIIKVPKTQKQQQFNPQRYNDYL